MMRFMCAVCVLGRVSGVNGVGGVGGRVVLDGVGSSMGCVHWLRRVFRGGIGMVFDGSVDRFGGPCGGLLGIVSRCCSTGKRGGLRG